jgi:hypothetical protein
MTNLKLAIAFLLSSTVAAVAQPVQRDNYPDAPSQYDPNDPYNRDRDRYDRYDRSQWRHRDQRWVTVASEFRASAGRQFLMLNGQTFTRLRLEAVRGAPMIRHVTVVYTNGTRQVIPLNARLPRGAGEVLRLNRMPIHRIVIHADPRIWGVYSLYGALPRQGQFGV